MPDLPSWATEKTPPAFTDDRPVYTRVEIDAAEMYPAILAEYQEFYSDPDNIPNEWKKADGELRKEWEECLSTLDPEEPCAYWCEVAHQTAKQCVWREFGFRVNISVKSSPEVREKYGQENCEPGRGPMKAAGGLGKDKQEARAHIKRMVGFLIT